MCCTSRTSISPNGMTTSHRINCCSIAFIETRFQQKLCSTIKYQVIHHRRMFPNSSNPCRMPRYELCMTLYSVQKWSAVNGIVFHDWRIITGGMNCVLHEPITCSVRIDILKYAAVQAGMSILG